MGCKVWYIEVNSRDSNTDYTIYIVSDVTKARAIQQLKESNPNCKFFICEIKLPFKVGGYKASSPGDDVLSVVGVERFFED